MSGKRTKKKTRKLKRAKLKFKREFKRQLRFGLSAAIGFLIAYSWREPFLRFFNNLVLNFTEKTLPYQAGITAALIITILGVVGILFISKYLD